MLFRLKYKCTITLTSLLEGQSNNLSLVVKLLRPLKISVLKNNLVSVYAKYVARYENTYSQDAFNHVSFPFIYKHI